MVDPKPLRLTARDKEDLTIVSACLQDAVTLGSELSYQRKQRRFAAAFNRFRWEDRFDKNLVKLPAERVRTGIHFDSVLSVQSCGLRRSADEILQLLAIEAEEREDGMAAIRLEFAGGVLIRLEVECIDCYLSDLGVPWRVRRTPAHPTQDGDS